MFQLNLESIVRADLCLATISNIEVFYALISDNQHIISVPLFSIYFVWLLINVSLNFFLVM